MTNEAAHAREPEELTQPFVAREGHMPGKVRVVLSLAVLLSVVGCSHRDPVLGSMEEAIRAQLGAEAQPQVGYLSPDSTQLLADFEAAVLPDTTQATFDTTARRIAAAVAERYPHSSRLASVVVSSGETQTRGVFRVLRQRIVTAAELR